MPAGPKNSLATADVLPGVDALEPKEPKSAPSRAAATEELESYLNSNARRDCKSDSKSGVTLQEAPSARGSKGRDSEGTRERSRSQRKRSRSRGRKEKSHRDRSRSYGSWGRRPGTTRSDDRGKGSGKQSHGGKAYGNHTSSSDAGVSGVARVHVTGLDTGTTEKDLNGIFGDYGKVLGMHVLPSRSRGGRPSAIIRYSTPQAAETAIIALKDKYQLQLAKPNPRWDKPDNTPSDKAGLEK